MWSLLYFQVLVNLIPYTIVYQLQKIILLHKKEKTSVGSLCRSVHFYDEHRSIGASVHGPHVLTQNGVASVAVVCGEVLRAEARLLYHVHCFIRLVGHYGVDNAIVIHYVLGRVSDLVITGELLSDPLAYHPFDVLLCGSRDETERHFCQRDKKNLHDYPLWFG